MHVTLCEDTVKNAKVSKRPKRGTKSSNFGASFFAWFLEPRSPKNGHSQKNTKIVKKIKKNFEICRYCLIHRSSRLYLLCWYLLCWFTLLLKSLRSHFAARPPAGLIHLVSWTLYFSHFSARLLGFSSVYLFLHVHVLLFIFPLFLFPFVVWASRVTSQRALVKFLVLLVF